MDLDDTLWELQWHSEKGHEVRRVVLTRRRLRHVITALAGLGLVVLVIIGLMPFGIRGFFSSFTVEAARRENRARRTQSQELHESLVMLGARLEGTLQRSRRVAWAVGLPATVWTPRMPGVPTGDDALVGWLQQAASRLDVMSAALDSASLRPPTGLPSLPMHSPVGSSRAVPVSVFGWQTSPFTGKLIANRGVTWACEPGEPVLAPGNATVAYAGTPQGRQAAEWMRLGTIVILDHGGGVLSVLGHLQQALVRRGQAVTRGQRVGMAGQTGWAKVPEVYLEIRWPLAGEGKPIDPSLLIAELPVADLDARLADPGAGLPSGYPLLDSLLGRKK
ncbi:MAG TPA: M23 family metallopeptidase [Thermoanaerobaculaceae bacterium]|nr:M23 family metallopeptidase [Thermoanaerobaculaceae bacterium]